MGGVCRGRPQEACGGDPRETVGKDSHEVRIEEAEAHGIPPVASGGRKAVPRAAARGAGFHAIVRPSGARPSRVAQNLRAELVEDVVSGRLDLPGRESSDAP